MENIIEKISLSNEMCDKIAMEVYEYASELYSYIEHDSRHYVSYDDTLAVVSSVEDEVEVGDGYKIFFYEGHCEIEYKESYYPETRWEPASHEIEFSDDFECEYNFCITTDDNDEVYLDDETKRHIMKKLFELYKEDWGKGYARHLNARLRRGERRGKYVHNERATINGMDLTPVWTETSWEKAVANEFYETW